MQGSSNTSTITRAGFLGPSDLLLLAAGVVLLAAFVLTDRGPGYGSAPDFSTMSLEQKKREFFAYLSPMISDINFEMAADRDRIRGLRDAYEHGEEPGWFERRWIERLAAELDVPLEAMPLGQALQMLELRAGVVPESIVLVQAAKESAWGTSRFARLGNNYFGQRCYRAGCGMQPLARPFGESFGLARFASVRASVESYMQNLNTHAEYRRFREMRRDLRDEGQAVTGLALVAGLSAYSERGAAYVAEITSMIRANGLE